MLHPKQFFRPLIYTRRNVIFQAYPRSYDMIICNNRYQVRDILQLAVDTVEIYSDMALQKS